MCRATTSFSTGPTIRGRTSSCCISRASGTRVGSPRSRGGWPRRSRSSPSNPAGRVPVRRRQPRTPGALATSDAVVDALFRQAGVIRTATLEELFDVAALLAHQPVPTGPRVAVLSNAGGPAILAADACEAHGLQLAALGDETVAQLRQFLPAAASVGNPVDMLASATPEQYRARHESAAGRRAGRQPAGDLHSAAGHQARRCRRRRSRAARPVRRNRSSRRSWVLEVSRER